MKRRTFLGMAAVAALGACKATARATVVDVYKSPTCSCCGEWSRYLRGDGFAVNIHEVADIDAFRTRSGVPDALVSCHTALIDGYVVEGHVPVADIRRMLAERPKARGLAAPGMPAIAPGMDGSHGPGYDVLLFQPDGTTRVYRSYPAA
jgi:hypothetical protein